MKTSTMMKSAYHEAHGPVGIGRASEETLALWDKIKKLPVTEYLIVEAEKGEDYQKLRGSLQVKLKKLAETSTFIVRFALNKHEKHVVIYKEAKAATR